MYDLGREGVTAQSPKFMAENRRRDDVAGVAHLLNYPNRKTPCVGAHFEYRESVLLT